MTLERIAANYDHCHILDNSEASSSFTEHRTRKAPRPCRVIGKVEAGADGAITQLFYNVDAYLDFMERCAKGGIKIPVVPGIMPITGFANTVRFCAGCAADLPRWMRLRLEELEGDKERLLEFGESVVTRLCETLLRNGAPGLPFCTINQAGPTLRLCRNLGLAAKA